MPRIRATFNIPFLSIKLVFLASLHEKKKKCAEICFKYLINTFIAVPVNYHTVSPREISFDNEIAADAARSLARTRATTRQRAFA